MQTEANNRNSDFTNNISLGGSAFDVLKYEYLMRSKIWRNTAAQGITWTGIPGLRGIGLGQSRISPYSSPFNKFGVNVINRPIQGILNAFGVQNDFVKSGISGIGREMWVGNGRTPMRKRDILSKSLGGTNTNYLKITQNSEELKLLEKNWVGSLFSSKVASNKFILPFEGAPGLARETLSHLANRKTAWKYAFTQKFIPAGIWASNFAFVAGLTAPLFRTAGEFVAGNLGQAERILQSVNRRSLDFGGKIHQSYMSGAGATERSRALAELQNSRTNARSFIGNEGSMYHS
jgi:hypothetical protein